MKSLTPQQLLEIDKCFQWTLEKLAEDGVPPRNILFGSTVDNWFKDRMKIVISGTPPGPNYERAYLRSEH